MLADALSGLLASACGLYPEVGADRLKINCLPLFRLCLTSEGPGSTKTGHKSPRRLGRAAIGWNWFA